jgi:hypothetical protein
MTYHRVDLLLFGILVIIPNISNGYEHGRQKKLVVLRLSSY